MLDIDAGSSYHPARDPFALSRIAAALEPLGLVSYLACTSSYSGGLHLYFPFQNAQSSWKLAITVTTLIENAGFRVKPGQLEVFPDPKPYVVNGQPNLFNAHRLPLQVGSYLVDPDFQPVWSDHQRFVQQWHFCQTQNDVRSEVLQLQLKQMKRRSYAVSGKAEKFINDLNAEIEPGWTDFGQTNYLLGRITMREYIFRHVLSGGEPLSGQALTEAVVDVARSLPGYNDYCRHRHDIEQRAEEWSRCIENSHYFHYGDALGKFKAKQQRETSGDSQIQVVIDQLPSWNYQQSESARERIRRAIADLLEQESLPATATARFRALVQHGIGGGTLYRYRELWHPLFLNRRFQEVNDLCLENGESVETPPHPPTSPEENRGDCFWEASPRSNPPSLLSAVGRNSLSSEPCSYSADPHNLSGRNSLLVQPAHLSQHWVKRQLAETRYVTQMQQFLHSGDPILIAEAIAWVKGKQGMVAFNQVANHQLVTDLRLATEKPPPDLCSGQTNDSLYSRS